MPDLQVLVITPGAGDTRKIAFEKSRDNFPILKNGFYGSTPPGTPENGQRWIDSSVATALLPMLRQNGVWIAELRGHTSTENLDLALNQMLNALLENLGTPPAAAPAEEGRAWWNTALKLMQAQTGTGALTIAGILEGSQYEDIELDVIDIGNDNGTVTVNARALRHLSTSAHRVGLAFPHRMSESMLAQDAKLIVRVVLNGTETTTEDLNLKLDLATVAPEQLYSRAKTADFATVNHPIVAAADKTMVEVELTVPYNDGTHPINGGKAIVADLGSTLLEVGSTAGLLIQSAMFRVPVFNYVNS